jgi:hypothetical protein
MADRPALTYEAFVALAMLYGLDMDEGHLRELFPEVEAMHERIASLDAVDADAVPPGSGLAPWGSSEPE